MEIENLIIIEGGSYNDIKRALKQWIELYSEDLQKDLIFKLLKIARGKHAIKADNRIDNERFFYLVNYLNYPDGIEYKINIEGFTTGKADNELKNKQILVYISDNETNYDNVFVVDSENINYRIDFGGKTEKIAGIKQYREPYDFETISSEIINIKRKEIIQSREEKNKKSIEKRFKIISAIGLTILTISLLFLLTTNDNYTFSKITFFLGMGIGVWFLGDYEMLREDKLYFRCLIIGLFFLIYGILIKELTLNRSQITDFGALYPLTLLIVQRPVRKIYIKILKREPKVDKYGTFADMIYTIILFLSFAVLPFILMDAIK